MISNHMTRFSSAVLLGLALGPGPAGAADYRLVLPETFSGDAKMLETRVWSLFAEGIGPGDRLTVTNGATAKRIARIDVPDDDRLTRLRRKARKFAPELGRIGDHLKRYAANGGAAPSTLDMIGTVQALGEARGTPEKTHLLVLGAPIQITRDPFFSMRDEDGRFCVPTDTNIPVRVALSPYGVAGLEGSLDGTVFHFCLTDQETRTPLEDKALRRFWSLWLKRQGGTLTTWTADLSVCMERFRDRVETALRVEPPNNAAPLGMRYVSRPDPDDRMIGDTSEGPSIFNLFTKVDHPTLDGVIVHTGVEYKPEDYPYRYVSSWCYFHKVGRNGAHIRLPVGDRTPASGPHWSTAKTDVLSSVRISKSDFEAARSACRFPE